VSGGFNLVNLQIGKRRGFAFQRLYWKSLICSTNAISTGIKRFRRFAAGPPTARGRDWPAQQFALFLILVGKKEKTMPTLTLNGGKNEAEIPPNEGGMGSEATAPILIKLALNKPQPIRAPEQEAQVARKTGGSDNQYRFKRCQFDKGYSTTRTLPITWITSGTYEWRHAHRKYLRQSQRHLSGHLLNNGLFFTKVLSPFLSCHVVSSIIKALDGGDGV